MAHLGFSGVEGHQGGKASRPLGNIHLWGVTRRGGANCCFGIFLQNTPLQTEISNFGRKMGTIPGGNFPLDNPLAQEYFFIVLSLSPA